MTGRSRIKNNRSCLRTSTDPTPSIADFRRLDATTSPQALRVLTSVLFYFLFMTHVQSENPVHCGPRRRGYKVGYFSNCLILFTIYRRISSNNNYPTTHKGVFRFPTRLMLFFPLATSKHLSFVSINWVILLLIERQKLPNCPWSGGWDSNPLT